MYPTRSQFKKPALRALSDVLEYGGSARSQAEATATLGGLMQHARTLQTLQDVLIRTLPPAMGRGCRVANLSGALESDLSAGQDETIKNRLD